jgi:hypothetical protein
VEVYRIPKSLLFEINTPRLLLEKIMAANQKELATAEEVAAMESLHALKTRLLLIDLSKREKEFVECTLSDLQAMLFWRAGERVFQTRGSPK